MIGSGSRYQGVEVLTYVAPDGTTVSYVARRPIPSGAVTIAGYHTVRKDERLDLISARTLGSPAVFWELADANHLIDPLSVPHRQGLTLVVPVPTPRGSS